MVRITELCKSMRWNYVTDPNFDIEKWLKEKLYVYDCDVCGNITSFWALIADGEPKFYKCNHDYYVEYEPEWDIINNFYISEIARYNLPENIAVYASCVY